MTFFYPVRDLSNDRVRLELFDPAKHLPLLLKEHQTYPELWRYFPVPGSAVESIESLTTWYDDVIVDEPSRCLWAVYDVESGDFAGAVGLLNTSVENKMTEIGWVTVAKRFHRTHINTNMNGLLLRFCFDDLRMRRVQWQAHAENLPSINAAKRLGFTLEGISRWQRVLPIGREGLTRPGEEAPGRHSAILAICWDDWEKPGYQEGLQAMMDRRA